MQCSTLHPGGGHGKQQETTTDNAEANNTQQHSELERNNTTKSTHNNTYNTTDSLRGSFVNIGTIQIIVAWPLRKDDTHTSRSVNRLLTHNNFYIITTSNMFRTHSTRRTWSIISYCMIITCVSHTIVYYRIVDDWLSWYNIVLYTIV